MGEIEVYWSNYVRETDGKEDKYYGIIELDDGYVVTLIPIDDEIATNATSIGHVTGVVEKFEDFEEALPTLITEEAGAPELVSYFSDKYKIVHGGVSYGRVFQVFLVIFAATTLIWALMYFIPGNYRKTRAYKRLAMRENAEVAESHINMAVSTGRYVSLGKLGVITDEYIVISRGKRSCIERKENLIWAYVSELKVGFTAYSNDAMVFLFKDKKSKAVAKFSDSHDEKYMVINAINTSCPQALAGFYVRDYKNMYKRNPDELSAFIAGLKQQMATAAPTNNVFANSLNIW
ncbi:MAG: hypothetical protein LBQ95_01950 [Lachnospiraceae bacterium]|jgi:hypothetical protein|nr:hypothetical protein [Lachnospiraceae bacterium]